MERQDVSKYFGNLWQALRGRNPFAAELENMKKECEAQRDKEVKGLQKLVENLRERVTTAERQMVQADKTLGQLMMAQQMLDKTNGNLEDLACRMELGKAEPLREFSQNLEWSNVLTRIAKCHISALTRKDELEKRQRNAARRAKT